MWAFNAQPSAPFLWDPTCSALSSCGVSHIKRTWSCCSESRRGYKDDLRVETPLLEKRQGCTLIWSPTHPSINPPVTLLGSRPFTRLLAYIALSLHMGLLWNLVWSFRLHHPLCHLRFHQFSIDKIHQQGY